MTKATRNVPTTLSDYLAILRRRRLIIVLVVVLAPVAAAIFSAAQSPLYEATAKVLLNRSNIVSAITNVTDPSLVGDPTRFLATQSDIARSPRLVDRVVQTAGVPGVTADSLLADSHVSGATNADLLNISVSNTDKGDAVRLANAYADQFTRFKTEIDTARIDDALTTLKGRIRSLAAHGVSPASPAYATLLQYQSQLETVGKLLANNTQVLNPAEPKKVRPQVKRNAILGGLLGIVLGVGLAFLAEALDRRVRVEKEIEESLGLPLLARIPRPPRRLSKANQLVMLAEPMSAESEGFRKLRTHIEFRNIEHHARTIMVTSAVTREGKSTTIANLAIAFARAGRRVALVDLDLRRPFLHTFFRLGSGPGVADVVLHHASLEDAIRPIALAQGVDLSPVPRPTRAPRRRHMNSRPALVDAPVQSSNGRSKVEGVLNVLPAGTMPSDAGEFVGRDGIRAIIDELREQFDYVLVDGPPLLAVGDSMTLSAEVDALFAVTRVGVVQRPVLHDLARHLAMCRAEKLGFVLTGAELEEHYGYYYYGYAPSPVERGEQHVP